MPCEGPRRWGVVVLLTVGCVPESPLMALESEGTIAQGDCDDATCECPIAYPDEDGDEHGDPLRGVHVCTELPPAMVLVGDDCYDGNAAAHPGALVYHFIDRGDGSFDYDCDGDEFVENAHMAECSAWPTCEPHLVNGLGWVGSLPDCGDAGDWMTDCDFKVGWEICRQEVDRGRLAACR